MADEQHSKNIDLNDAQQVAHWANLFNISEARLRSLVLAFGDDAATLAEVLGHGGHVVRFQ